MELSDYSRELKAATEKWRNSLNTTITFSKGCMNSKRAIS